MDADLCCDLAEDSVTRESVLKEIANAMKPPGANTARPTTHPWPPRPEFPALARLPRGEKHHPVEVLPAEPARQPGSHAAAEYERVVKRQERRGATRRTPPEISMWRARPTAHAMGSSVDGRRDGTPVWMARTTSSPPARFFADALDDEIEESVYVVMFRDVSSLLVRRFGDRQTGNLETLPGLPEKRSPGRVWWSLLS